MLVEKKNVRYKRTYITPRHEETPVATTGAIMKNLLERWETVEWAIANGMVPISNVFGGHHYVNDFEAEDLDFYKIFKRHCSDAVSYTHLDVYKRQDCRFLR